MLFHGFGEDFQMTGTKKIIILEQRNEIGLWLSETPDPMLSDRQTPIMKVIMNRKVGELFNYFVIGFLGIIADEYHIGSTCLSLNGSKRFAQELLAFVGDNGDSDSCGFHLEINLSFGGQAMKPEPVHKPWPAFIENAITLARGE